MLVDIIIPTYNRAETILRTINSVLKQSHQDFNLHVVDDGSTDHTQEILKQLNDSRLHLHYQENKGVSAARNLGVKLSSASWISFLDSDDIWLTQKLAEQISYLQSHPECYFLHSEEIWIRNGVRVNPKKKHEKSNIDIFNRSLEFCLISPSTTILRRDIFLEHNGFDEEMTVCEDYDLWLKILLTANDKNIGFISNPLIEKYGGHEDQLSMKFVAMDYWRIKSLINLFQSSKASLEQKEKIKEVALRKSELLIKNYHKHGNTEKSYEIEAWLKLLN